MINKIEIILGNIINMDTEAIVNPANNTLLGGGGVDGAIHKAGGPIILEQCKSIGGCPTGRSKITTAGDLKTNYIIHTVGPKYKDGTKNESKLLYNAYLNTMKLAYEYKIQTISFPFISTGAYNYPKEDAAKIALDSMKIGIEKYEFKKINMVVADKESLEIFNRLIRL